MMKRRDWFILAFAIACGIDNPRLAVCIGVAFLFSTLLSSIIVDWKAGRLTGS